MPTWTNIPKPSAQIYTKLAKPTNGYVLRVGMATGLLCPPTYAITRTFGNTYTNIPKPINNSWTSIPKPT